MFDWAKAERAKMREAIERLTKEGRLEEAEKFQADLENKEAPWYKCTESFDVEGTPLFERQPSDPGFEDRIRLLSQRVRKRKAFEDKIKAYTKKLKADFDYDLTPPPPFGDLDFGDPDYSERPNRRIRPTYLGRPEDDDRPGPSNFVWPDEYLNPPPVRPSPDPILNPPVRPASDREPRYRSLLGDQDVEMERR